MSLWMLLLLFTVIKIPMLGMMLWMPFRDDHSQDVLPDSDSSEPEDGGSKTMPAGPYDPHPRGSLCDPRPRRGPGGCAPLASPRRARRPSAAPRGGRACKAQRLRLR